MYKISPESLVNVLKSSELSIRTGLLMYSGVYNNFEPELAVILSVGHQNICSKILDQASPATNLLALNRNIIFDALDSIIDDERIPGRCILVSGVDLLLAAISADELQHFWAFLRNNYRRNRGVIILFPETARNLLSMDEIKRWNDIGRISLWEAKHNDL
jgi:hypothetical protein